MKNFYVNVYLHDKGYGGPEEGGWWYDVYEPATASIKTKHYGNTDPETSGNWWKEVPLSFITHDKDSADWLKDQLETWCAKENKNRNSNIHSVASEGEFLVIIERNKPWRKPERRPRYE